MCVLLVTSLLQGCCRPEKKKECESTGDCTGTRVCVNNACVDPPRPANDPPARTAAPAPKPKGPAAPTTASIAKSITVGKFPEQVLVWENDAFVAVSGSRVVKRVDLQNGTILAEIKLDRTRGFPTLIKYSNNVIYAYEYNSLDLYTIDASSNKGKKLAKTLFFEDMFGGSEGMFGIALPGDGPANALVVRVDPNGHQLRSATLGNNGSGIVVSHGKVWAVTSDGVHVLEPATLAEVQKIAIPNNTAHLAWDDAAVFLVAKADKVLYRIDPKTFQFTKTTIGEGFAAASNEKFIAVIGESGNLSFLDRSTLEVRSKMNLGRPVKVNFLIHHPRMGALLLTEHAAMGETETNGRLHVITYQ